MLRWVYEQVKQPRPLPLGRGGRPHSASSEALDSTFYLENIKKYYFLNAVKKSKFSGQRTESRGRVMVEGVPFFPVRFPGGFMAGENPISSMEKLENSSSAGFFKS